MRLILQLELPTDARMLPKTRRAVEGYMEELGATAMERADVVLALNEACANVIRHAFPDGLDGVIRVRAEIGDRAVVVEVDDDGVGFDPCSAAAGPAGPDAVSGRGLGIISRLMTTVELASPVTGEGGTRVRMEKRLSDGAVPSP